MQRREIVIPTKADMRAKAEEWNLKFGVCHLLYSGRVIDQYIAVTLLLLFFSIPYIIYGIIAL